MYRLINFFLKHQFGVEEDSIHEQNKHIILANRICLMIGITVFGYGIIFSFTNLKLLSVLCFITAALYQVIPLLNKFGKFHISKIYFILFSNFIIIVFAVLIGRQAGVHFFFFVNAGLPLIIFKIDEKVKIVFGYCVLLISILLTGASYYVIKINLIELNASVYPILSNSLFLSAIVIVAVATFYFFYISRLAEFKLMKANTSLKHEINERVQTEKSLKESEEKYRLAIEYSSNTVILFDRDGIVILLNKIGAANFGGVPSDFIGKSIYELFPDDADKYMNRYRKIMNSGIGQDFEDVIELSFGTRWYLSSTQPFRNAENKILGVQVISKDITERKEMVEKMQITLDELKRSNEELEQFAYIASHDLQEPLRMVSGYLRLIEKRYKNKLDEEAEEFINFAVDGASRMRVLINDLLAYSRITTQSKELKLIDLNEISQRTQRNLQELIKENNAVITYDNLPKIMGDDIQINRVMQNLINNAIKFNENEAPEVSVSLDSRSEDYVISIKDNGIGISLEEKDNIFKLFKRLHSKNEYAGTGMGLAICRKIIELHGGKIWVESELGKGSDFCFSIPKPEL